MDDRRPVCVVEQMLNIFGDPDVCAGPFDSIAVGVESGNIHRERSGANTYTAQFCGRFGSVGKPVHQRFDEIRSEPTRSPGDDDLPRVIDAHERITVWRICER